MIMMRNILLIYLLFLMAACTAPTTKVTLLPDKDGKTGRVLVKSEDTIVELSEAYTFVSVSGAAEPIKVQEAAPAKIQKESEKLFTAEPESTVHFILYFDYDSTNLTEKSRRLLVKIIDAILQRKHAEVNIIGHTDTKGSDKHNRELSLGRAKSVDKILRKYYKGLKNVHIQSFGEKDLLIPTGDNVDEPKNRRVEIMIR